MPEKGSVVGDIAGNLLAAALMIVLAVISFFVTVFVVDAGASLAGYSDNEYVVQSAAILAGAAIIAGGIAPVSALSGIGTDDRRDPLE